MRYRMRFYQLVTPFLVTAFSCFLLVFSVQAHAVSELWLRFAHISDTQIVDAQTPARAVRAERWVSGAWRAHELYGTQTLEATLGVLNAHHQGTLQPQLQLDFLIHTGDAVESSQKNELDWYLSTMDGTWVHPDSGALEGAKRNVAPEDNPTLPFLSQGLDKTIPWYAVYGNHDGLACGNFRIDTSASSPEQWFAPVHSFIAWTMGLGKINRRSLLATDDQSAATLTNDREWADLLTLKLPLDKVPFGAIAPDKDRRYVARRDFIRAHLDSVTTPPGHGFSETSWEDSTAYYSVRPKASVPVRLLVLDTVHHDGQFGQLLASGVLTRYQFEEFLLPEIRKAQTQNEFVIVASHHPSQDFQGKFGSKFIDQSEFRAVLANQPNVLAHISGHKHKHAVKTIDGRHPYLEIITGSVLDYPQEARVLELFYFPEENMLRLQSRILSHREQPTRLSLESYRRSEIDARLKNEEALLRTAFSFFSDLLFPLPFRVPAGVEILSLEESRGTSRDRDFIFDKEMGTSFL